jgi:hypothetical protein
MSVAWLQGSPTSYRGSMKARLEERIAEESVSPTRLPGLSVSIEELFRL